MTSLFRKFTWWLQRRRKEEELREELQFHLAEEAAERHADGLSGEQARRAARRDLGNVTLVQENTRALWSWILLKLGAGRPLRRAGDAQEPRVHGAGGAVARSESGPTRRSTASWIRSCALASRPRSRVTRRDDVAEPSVQRPRWRSVRDALH
jgi:hypothetical protein